MSTYLEELRDNMASFENAQVAIKGGRAFAYRAWPDRGAEARTAALDGLASLRFPFPLYLVSFEGGPENGGPPAEDAFVRVYRASDRALITAGPFCEAMQALVDVHTVGEDA